MKHEKVNWIAGVNFLTGFLLVMGTEGTFQTGGQISIPVLALGTALILLSYVLVKLAFYLEDHER